MPNIDMNRMQTAQDRAAATAQTAQAEARAYLARTDWYVLRQVETGKAIPDEIAQLRREARRNTEG